MSPPVLQELWVYLSQTPLLWLTATLSAYVAADWISARLSRHPLANPVVMAAGLLILLLVVTGTPYRDYFEGAQFVHFLLGPATVALAVPLWRNRARVRENLTPMCAALVAGSLTAIGSAVLVSWLLGAPREAANLVGVCGVGAADDERGQEDSELHVVVSSSRPTSVSTAASCARSSVAIASSGGRTLVSSRTPSSDSATLVRAR